MKYHHNTPPPSLKIYSRFSLKRITKKYYFPETISALIIIGVVGVFMFGHAGQRSNAPIVYQGRLMDANYVPVADGTYYMRFSIYTAATSGTCLWRTGVSDTAGTCTGGSATSTAVTVTRGLFSATLGTGVSGNPELATDFNSTASYLGVTQCGTSNSCGSEMTPRKQLGGVPYAYNTDKVDGWDPALGISGGQTLTGGTAVGDMLTLKSTSGVGTTDAIIFQVGNNGATEAMRIIDSGYVGIGTTAPGALLTLKAASEPILRFDSNNSNENNRNWAIMSSHDAFGDFSIRQSDALSGDPYASGTTRFYIKNTGSVGIGTTAPGAKLDVSGAIKLSATSSFPGTAVGNAYSFLSPDGGLVLYADGTTYDVDIANASGTDVFAIPSGTTNAYFTGNVGIGITTPTGKLEVEGGVDSTPTATGTNIADYIFRYSPTGTNLTLDFGGSSAATPYNWIQGRNITSYQSPYALALNPTGGNVGIGTTAPDGTLTVVATSSNAYINLKRNSQSAGEVGLNLYGGTSGVNWGIYQPINSNDLRFYRGSDFLTIASDGKVGIGTSTPAALLHLYNSDYTKLKLERTGTNVVQLLFADPSGTVYIDGAGGGSGYLDLNGKMMIQNGGKVGIGVTSPGGTLEVGANADHDVMFTEADTGTGQTTIHLRKSRGTLTSASSVAISDPLGQVVFRGYDGSGWKSGAMIKAIIDYTPGTNDMPTYLSFLTTPDGSATLAERLRIDSRGYIIFKKTTNDTPSDTCDATLTGALIPDPTNHRLYMCDGSNWKYVTVNT